MGLLTANAALPDLITGVSVNGTVSATGSVLSECGPESVTLPPACTLNEMGIYYASTPLTFSGTNTQLGMFSSSGSASGVFGGTVQAGASQDVGPSGSAMPDSWFVQLSENAAYLAEGSIVYFDVTVTNTIYVDFTLGSETLMSFGVSASGSNSAELLDSQGNMILSLPNSANTLVTLQSGTYQLEDSLVNTFMGSFGGGGGSDTAALSFTAITPELRWEWVGPALLIILGRFLLYRGGAERSA